MRITSKGQITIPQAVREAAGLLPNTEAEVVIIDGVVRIEKSRPGVGRSRGERLISTMRRARTIGLSADELLAMTRGE